MILVATVVTVNVQVCAPVRDDILSYPLTWQYNMDNDKIFATVCKTEMVQVISLDVKKTVSVSQGIAKKRAKKTAPPAQPPKDCNHDADKHDESDMDSDEEEYQQRRAIVRGAMKKVGKIQEKIDALRAQRGSTDNSGTESSVGGPANNQLVPYDGSISSSATSSGQRRDLDPHELMKPILAQIAADPELVDALDISDDENGDVSAALIASELLPNDEANDSFAEWKASDEAEVHAEAFEKRDAALAASLEDISHVIPCGLVTNIYCSFS